MPRVPVHTLADAPAASRPTLAVLAQRMGKVNVGEVTDVTWKAALAAGWTETELAETFAHLVLNLFTNYFHHYVDTDLDLPAAPGIPG